MEPGGLDWQDFPWPSLRASNPVLVPNAGPELGPTLPRPKPKAEKREEESSKTRAPPPSPKSVRNASNGRFLVKENGEKRLPWIGHPTQRVSQTFCPRNVLDPVWPGGHEGKRKGTGGPFFAGQGSLSPK